MTHTTSICYPWIEVRDKVWLRRGCLYRDIIQTIAPQSIGEPYTDTDSRRLEDEGVLQPFYVASDLDAVEDIADELGRFRTAIAELPSRIAEDLPLEAMRQKVWDLYTNELQPSVADLKGALDGHRIGWVAKAILKTSFLSAGPTSLLVTVGLSVPQALWVGTGISLVAMGLLYSSDKRGDIRSNPYSYLLRAERKFGS